MDKGKFYYGKNTELTPQEAHYELGIVSYPGQGKYTEANIFLPYHELPDSEEVASDLQMQTISPPGMGWWPVIALQTEIEPATLTKKVLITCWYQLLQDGRVIAWWVYL